MSPFFAYLAITCAFMALLNVGAVVYAWIFRKEYWARTLAYAAGFAIWASVLLFFGGIQ